MSEFSGYNTLIQKLDAFIRKYYKNQLVRGLIYGLGLLLGFFLITNILEYFGQFETGGRTFLFWSFITLSAFVLGKYIAIPLFKLGNLGKVISHGQAAEIVGNHFTDVKDKLINTLQLKELSQNTPPAQYALVNASINQRIEELRPVPFTSAIDFSENKKHLWLLMLPLFILAGVLVFKSDIITSSTDRLINHALVIEKVAPFSFVMNEDKLEVIQKEDFKLVLNLEGNQVPDKVYVEHDGKRVRLEKVNNVTYKHTFRNVQEDMSFVFYAGDYNSKEYNLKTIPNPTITNFMVQLDYPGYTNKQDETLTNTGDIILPEGTKVKWVFKTDNTNNVSFSFGNEETELIETLAGQFELEKRVTQSTNYIVNSRNQFITNKDSVSYFINAISDEYPTIDVQEKQDTMNPKLKYFSGSISDDYGFTNLQFIYRVRNQENASDKGKFKRTKLQASYNYNKDQFYHYWDISELKLESGDQIEYYFQVWDNDAVNGAKTARTRTQLFSAPTKEELFKNVDEANKDIKEDLEESIKEAQDLQKELEEMRKEMFDKKNLDWQDKNRLNEFLEKQQYLENRIEDIQQTNEQINQQKEEFSEQDKALLEKQKMLEELFDKIMDEDMKKMYEELQKLMEEMNKDKIQEKLEELQYDQEDMEKELDRSLELFKQFEFEQKAEEVAERLEELAEKQEELAEETKNKEKSSEELQKEQEKLNEEFKKVKEEMEKLDELNEKLQDKNDIDSPKEEMESIEKEMEESSEELGEKKEKKASESQESAAEQMKDSAKKLKDMLEKEEQESYEEDMQSLRMLLENLITFSFDQEGVMAELKTVNTKDPKYVDLGREQRKLKDDAKIIEDSLIALSKRVLPLATSINNEIRDMKRGVDKSIHYIKERQTPRAREQQQYTMTATNNLALLLDEMLQQMQSQMESKMPGSGQCNKPGGSGSKPSSGKQSLSEMRKQMQKQMEKMKKAMEEGKKPGGEKPGDKPGDKPGNKPGDKPGEGQGGVGGFPGNSEELAKMAAQQAAIRREIQKLSQQMNEDGSGNGNGLKKIAKDMEKLEEDLVNKRISNDFLKRQQDIVSRLLEHEKAERQQDIDKKRKADQAKSKELSNPKGFLEYKHKKEKEIELLKTVPADLKQYYKNKVNEYYNKVN